MTEKHLNWCLSHDWGKNAVLVNGKISGLVDRSVTNGIVIEKEVSFVNFSELYEWAGY